MFLFTFEALTESDRILPFFSRGTVAYNVAQLRLSFAPVVYRSVMLALRRMATDPFSNGPNWISSGRISPHFAEGVTTDSFYDRSGSLSNARLYDAP